MNDKDDLGELNPTTPLHQFLSRTILGTKPEQAQFRMRKLHPKHLVVLYTEQHSGEKLVCKFYERKKPAESEESHEYFRAQLRVEYERMLQVRALGFHEGPYRVVKPLALHDSLEYLMVQEFADGEKLDAFLKVTYKGGPKEPLLDCLERLGGFLGKLHGLTHTRDTVPSQNLAAKMEKYIAHLADKELATPEQIAELGEVRLNWVNDEALQSAPELLIHGDATPLNFVFQSDALIAIDLERSHWGDALQDVGSVEAEIRQMALDSKVNASCEEELASFHAAYQKARNHWAASVGHQFEDAGAQRRLQFWKALYFIRNSRNDWIGNRQRTLMLEEAIKWLKSRQ